MVVIRAGIARSGMLGRDGLRRVNVIGIYGISMTMIGARGVGGRVEVSHGGGGGG